MPRTRTLEQRLQAQSRDPDVAALSEGLTDDDPAVREACAQKLAALKDPAAASFLRHALDDDEEQVQVWGAYGLGLLGRPEDEQVLRKAAHAEAPLVQIWGTFGLARIGRREAAEALVEMLDLPDLELRSNAADAIQTLQDFSYARPRLERRLLSTDPRKRAWAGALLHHLGHSKAYALWRDALQSQDACLDAALAAPFTHDPRAARDLLSLLVGMEEDELAEPAAIAGGMALGEILSAPLLDLGLHALVTQARSDPELGLAFIYLALRRPPLDPEVLARANGFVGALPPKQLALVVISLLEPRDPQERLDLLAHLPELTDEGMRSTMEALSESERRALVAALFEAAEAGAGEQAHLASLLSFLRQTPYGQKLATLPEEPWGPDQEEAPQTELVEVVEEPPAESEGDEAGAEAAEDQGADEFGGDDEFGMDDAPASDDAEAKEEAGEEEEGGDEDFGFDDAGELDELDEDLDLLDDDLGEEDEDEPPPTPPTPPEVGLRALALAATLSRAQLEQQARGRGPEAHTASTQVAHLTKWVRAEREKLPLSTLELELLNTGTGEWPEEAFDALMGQADALAAIAWATGLHPALPQDVPANPSTVLTPYPLAGSAQAFAAKTRLRPIEELEAAREVWEVWHWRAEQEAAARKAELGEDPIGEQDLDLLIEQLRPDGFDPTIARGKPKGVLLAEALRFLALVQVKRLADAGRVTAKDGDLVFKGKGLRQLSEPELIRAIRMAAGRHQALSWLCFGGPWDAIVDLGDEEPG